MLCHTVVHLRAGILDVMGDWAKVFFLLLGGCPYCKIRRSGRRQSDLESGCYYTFYSRYAGVKIRRFADSQKEAELIYAEGRLLKLTTKADNRLIFVKDFCVFEYQGCDVAAET
jgi:hypothetical protein